MIMNISVPQNPFNTDSQTPEQAEKLSQYNEKQRSILEAAHQVISEKGIEKTTITQIAKRSGVVDSIIYHYFKNKEDLLLSILDLQLIHGLQDLKFHFKGIIGPVSKLGKMIWYHLSMNDQEDTHMRKNMLLECRSYENFTDHKCFETLKEYVGIMDDVLGRGIEAGFFSPDLKIPVVRTIILSLLDETAFMCAGGKGSVNALSDFDRIMDLILAMTAIRPAPEVPKDKPDKYYRILAAAKKLYAEKGFVQSTMVDVANEAGVAEGTIYDYFKNKQDLLLSITKEYFGKLKHDLDDSFDIHDPVEKMHQALWHHFRIFASDRDLVTVFLKNTKLRKNFYLDDAHQIFVSYHDKICAILEEGQNRGAFRPEVDSRVFRNMIMGSFAGMYTRWYFRTPIYALDYMSELAHFTDLICRSIQVLPQKTE